jgi:hypothetical protein
VRGRTEGQGEPLSPASGGIFNLIKERGSRGCGSKNDRGGAFPPKADPPLAEAPTRKGESEDSPLRKTERSKK